MQVEERKQWALEFKAQDVFHQEFLRRYPNADYIPERNKWLGVQDIKGQGIDAFSLEQMVDDKPIKKEEGFKFEIIQCRGCEKMFDPMNYKKPNTDKKKQNAANLARRAHERHCKAVLDVRA